MGRVMWMQAVAGMMPAGSALAQAAAAPAGPVEAGDIRGIRGPVEIPVPPDWRPWVLGGLGAVALLAAIWMFVRARKRRARAHVLSARARALAALEKAHALMEPESSRDYAYAVSDALRGFIEARFRLPSTRQTTEEFLRAIAERGGGLGPYRPALGEFLGLCDAGKFGGWQLDQGTLEAMHVSAVALVYAEEREVGDRKIDDRKMEREDEVGSWDMEQNQERTMGV